MTEYEIVDHFKLEKYDNLIAEKKLYFRNHNFKKILSQNSPKKK